MSFSAKTTLDLPIALDAIYNPGTNVFAVQYQTPHPTLKPLFYQALVFILTMSGNWFEDQDYLISKTISI